ncbi:MAG TPA: peptidylprolyl isomerase [Bacteroidales bacterium]|nr:peptidylprolyl isomerase [Bacteroidales bacterium]
MRKILLACLLSVIFSNVRAQADDPVVMNINGEDILRSEFEYNWKKNYNISSTDKKNLDEYLELFVNFKLKVAEAKAQGIDTTQAFITELRGYRSQLTAPYLTDKQTEEKLIDEAYAFTSQYVDLSHILIPLDRNAAPQDTLTVYNQLMELRERILKGEDFGRLAAEYSQDNSSRDGGRIGTFLCSRLIYPIAKTAFYSQPGEIGLPVRTAFGYHLIKLNAKHQAPGQYISGHILQSAPSGAPKEVVDSAKQHITEIWGLLESGQDFAQLADTRNDDRYVVGKGGKYQELRPGSLPYEYEQQVFDLKDGEYSQPFKTEYGWHIVKRFEITPLPEKGEILEELKSTLQRDERAQAGRKALVNQLKKDYNYQPDTKALAQFEQTLAGLENPDSTLRAEAARLPVLASFEQNSITPTDFAEYYLQRKSLITSVPTAFEDYVEQRILAYEDSRLEKKYPDFGNLMREYHDGILLFEISNQKVWEKAVEDQEGLAAYFKANKADYQWDKPRFKGALIHCADETTAKKAKKMAGKLKDDSLAFELKRSFNNDSTTLIKVEQGIYVMGEYAPVDKLVFKSGDWNPDKSFPIVFTKGKVLKKGPEEYSDVRGAVIGDYQNYLEKEWIKELKQKYPVSIFEEHLQILKTE